MVLGFKRKGKFVPTGDPKNRITGQHHKRMIRDREDILEDKEREKELQKKRNEILKEKGIPITKHPALEHHFEKRRN